MRNANRFHRSQPLTTTLEKLKALDAQRAQLLDDAKKEALDNAEKAVAELNELGFHYTLTEGPSVAASIARAPRKASSQAQAPKRQARDLPCPICHFKTNPHPLATAFSHAARSVRSAGSSKGMQVIPPRCDGRALSPILLTRKHRSRPIFAMNSPAWKS